jgi:acyl dehydratase
MTGLKDIRPGVELPPLRKSPITRVQLARYAGASGDFNPIHIDEPYAQAAGMGGVIAHGMLSMAFLGQLATDWAGAGAVLRLEARFRSIVRPGDVLTVRGAVSEKDEAAGTVRLRLWCENQEGTTVTEGGAVVRLT